MKPSVVESLLCLAVFGAVSVRMLLQERVSWPEPGPGMNASAWTIDLATASDPELQLLPGIGPVRSRAIIELRARCSQICVEDLAMVPGIGPITVRRLAESGLVRGSEPIDKGRDE